MFPIRSRPIGTLTLFALLLSFVVGGGYTQVTASNRARAQAASPAGNHTALLATPTASPVNVLTNSRFETGVFPP